MSYSNSFSAYIIRITERNSNKIVKLGSFDGYNNLIGIIFDYFRKIENSVTVYKAFDKAVSVEKISNEDDSLYGILKSGQFGRETKIINIDSGDTTYNKRKKDAEMIPFYWNFYLPSNSFKGILLIQSVGVSGILVLIRSIVEHEFNRQFQDYRLEINQLAPQDAVREFLNNGEVIKVTLIKHTIPSDPMDRFQAGSGEQEGSLALTIQPKSKKYFDAFKQKFTSPDQSTNMMFEFLGIEYEDIKAEVKINGKSRMISISNPKEILFRFNIDEDEDIENGDNGFPTFDSLNKIGKKIITDISNTGVLS